MAVSRQEVELESKQRPCVSVSEACVCVSYLSESFYFTFQDDGIFILY